MTTTIDWTDLCPRGELEDGNMYPFEVDGRRVLLCVVDDKVYATNNVCSHAFALLSDGWLEDGLVECPLHGAQFDVASGAPVMGPADCPINTYPTRERDGRVEVLLNSEASHE